MRRVLLALVLCLAALSAACAGGNGGLPAVRGSFGRDPMISVPAAKPPHGLVVQTVAGGSGPVVHPGDFVMINVEGKVWAGDRLLVDTFTSRKPQGLPLRAGLPAWRRLAGQRVGSRVLMVVPPSDGFGPRGDASLNVTGRDTLVFVFDILAAYPPGAHASGTAVPYRPAPGLPRVTASARGPVITVPRRAAPPPHLVTRVLIRGHGPVVAAGDTVVTQYAAVVWRTGRVFSSSWQLGSPEAFQLSSGQVIPGWREGLAGQRAGSRVLLIIPPRLGYGSAGDPPLVTGTDTVVYVVDILAITRR